MSQRAAQRVLVERRACCDEQRRVRIAPHGAEHVCGVGRGHVHAVRRQARQFTFFMNRMGLHQQTVTLERILFARAVVAGTVLFRGVDAEIARRQIGAPEHFKWIAHAIAVRVCQARAVARVASLGVGAGTVVHVGHFVEVARLRVHATFQGQCHVKGLHELRRVATRVRGGEGALNHNLQAVVAQGVFQHLVPRVVVASVHHHGFGRGHHFARKFIHRKHALRGEHEHGRLQVEHREHDGVHNAVSSRIGGLIHPRTEVTLQAFERIFEGAVNQPSHTHGATIVGRLWHGHGRIRHGVCARQRVVRREVGPHRRFHVHTIVHRIANAVSIDISDHACACTIEPFGCVLA